MRLTLYRILIIAMLALILYFGAHFEIVGAMMVGFIAEYIVEPLLTKPS